MTYDRLHGFDHVDRAAKMRILNGSRVGVIRAVLWIFIVVALMNAVIIFLERMP